METGARSFSFGTGRARRARPAAAADWLAAAWLAAALILLPGGLALAQTTPAQDAADTPSETAAAAPAPQGAIIAQDARLAGDEVRTRLVVDLDRTVEFRAFTLSNPDRVIVDLPDVTFAFKPDPAQLKRGLVSTYRYGVFAPGKARIVLEATGPVAIDRAFVIEKMDDQPARLVVDLVKTDAASASKSQAEARSAGAAATPEPAAPSAADMADARPVIVLDPGHGGIDSGTSGRSAFVEKTLVLEAALALRDKLVKSGRFRVVMTREDDTFVPLGDRVKIARANRADLFLSLHADALAAGDGRARGASVYTLSDTASDAEAAHLADKENKADLIAGVDLSAETDEVAGILVDLAQRETRNFSVSFARALVGTMRGSAPLHREPLKSAGFRVLRAHDVPSVLLELGYMSSREDLKLLTSQAWRDKVTDAIVIAIERFFDGRRAGAGGASVTVTR